MALEFIPSAITIECGRRILIPRSRREKIIYRLKSDQIKFFKINSELPDWAKEIPEIAVEMSFDEFRKNQWTTTYGKPTFYYCKLMPLQHKD